MRSMDIYSEKGIRDSSPDKIASSKEMLREVNNLSLIDAALTRSIDPDTSVAKHVGRLQLVRDEEKERQQNGSLRDKMAFTSVAMCSPLMLMGMGAAFSLADEFDVLHDQKALGKGVDEGVKYRLDTAQALAYKDRMAALNAKEKEHSQERIHTSFSTPIESTHSMKRKQKDIAFFQNRPNRFNDRSSLKMKKMLKERQELLDYLEKNRGTLDLKTVSSITSQLELLDKAIKRAG